MGRRNTGRHKGTVEFYPYLFHEHYFETRRLPFYCVTYHLTPNQRYKIKKTKKNVKYIPLHYVFNVNVGMYRMFPCGQLQFMANKCFFCCQSGVTPSPVSYQAAMEIGVLVVVELT